MKQNHKSPGKGVIAMLLLAVIALFAVLFIAASVIFQRTDPITPLLVPNATLPTAQSIFEEDTCAPPCWFGLTPGESTTEEVATILTSLEEIFSWRLWPNEESNILDPISGYVVEGNYHLSWLDFPRDDIALSGGYIRIHEGFVDSIGITPNRLVSLGEVIAAFGSPDYIQMAHSVNDGPYLDLAYMDLRVFIELGSEATCRIENLDTAFHVFSLRYYAPIEISGEPNIDEITELFDPFINEVRSLSLGVWETWLAGEVAGPCEVFFDRWLPHTPTPAF